MIKRLKKIVSLLLVFFLITPTLVKLEHQHDEFVCSAKGEKHFHTYHEKCTVCHFEYSLFLAEKTVVSQVGLTTYDAYRDGYFSADFTRFPKYSFLLRAPPVLQM